MQELIEAAKAAAEYLQGTIEWPASEDVQKDYSRTNWQQGYDCATNDAAKDAAKPLADLRSALSNAETRPALRAAAGWRPSREEVARIVEGAIADSIGGDWDDARDQAIEAILALGAVPEGGEDE